MEQEPFLTMITRQLDGCLLLPVMMCWRSDVEERRDDRGRKGKRWERHGGGGAGSGTRLKSGVR